MWRLLGQVIQTDLSLSLRLRLTLRKVENTRRNKIVHPGRENVGKVKFYWVYFSSELTEEGISMGKGN